MANDSVVKTNIVHIELSSIAGDHRERSFEDTLLFAPLSTVRVIGTNWKDIHRSVFACAAAWRRNFL